MISEVQKNKDLIRIGDSLIYTDSSNCQKWVVTDLFEGGFEAKDDFETRDFMFEELQPGWTISEKTKQAHILFDKTVYCA